jgi:hypothetical protein
MGQPGLGFHSAGGPGGSISTSRSHGSDGRQVERKMRSEEGDYSMQALGREPTERDALFVDAAKTLIVQWTRPSKCNSKYHKNTDTLETPTLRGTGRAQIRRATRIIAAKRGSASLLVPDPYSGVQKMSSPACFTIEKNPFVGDRCLVLQRVTSSTSSCRAEMR